MATASGGPAANPRPAPVGYLVNHADGLTGAHGIGFDYVLGSGGLYVQSESANLTARALVAPCEVRGLAPVTGKVELAHGPIPTRLFEIGLRWFEDDPGTERFFAVRWDGRSYRLVVPEQEGTASSLKYTPPAGVVAEFHSHGSSRAFFSKTDDRRAGLPTTASWDASMTPWEMNLRVGVYGHFAPVDWPQVFDGPAPGLRLVGEEPDSTDQITEEVLECLTTLTTRSCWTTPG